MRATSRSANESLALFDEGEPIAEEKSLKSTGIQLVGLLVIKVLGDMLKVELSSGLYKHFGIIYPFADLCLTCWRC